MMTLRHASHTPTYLSPQQTLNMHFSHCKDVMGSHSPHLQTCSLALFHYGCHMDAEGTSGLGEAMCVAKVEEVVHVKRERQAEVDDSNIVSFATSFFFGIVGIVHSGLVVGADVNVF